MIRSPFDTKTIGVWLASVDDEKQAELFNSFGREFKIVCGSTDDTQAYFIVKALDQSGVRVIKQLAEHIRLREEERDL